MRQVYVVYDDSIIPSSAVKSITGGKSFGKTIFKRITVREHTERLSTDIGCIKSVIPAEGAHMFLQSAKDADAGVIKLYSCFIISNLDEYRILAEKAVYAHENYKVCCNNKIACVIYSDINAFLAAQTTAEDSYSEISCDAFTDISDINNFRQFITSGFEARFFNSVSGDNYTVVKKSKNAKKIESEYKFYGFLPDSMKQYFVMPYDYKVLADGTASYTMERFNMADLAIRYVHGAISLSEFSDILDKLFHFISIRAQKNVSYETYCNTAESLYIKKVDERISQLKECQEFKAIEELIKNSTNYNSIDEIISEYKRMYNIIRSNKKFMNVLVVGHGDLCFSNILYSKEVSMIKLIDPKGALSAEDIYTDPYYDVAKLSHSVCGYYDYFNSDLYEITLDDKLKSHLKIDFDNTEYVKLFKAKLESYDLDFRLVRLYECSLFLSMLPLHIDRPKKVYAFILNAIAILDSIKE